ncbi:hypothetical protein [Candidatus Magnetobacterium casense]|uniref:Uncharacterized protein n=1 Tax=Candidatus Magnetobacterium casense TaxID=1455061 RepID=A0ABS6S470_9BACT|nr:hypothetical protein [Candidatus Magnetobacterium casensis]MBV6343648.1 hypothetical protein [Candidatus Magnetobacterium casensis]
MAARSLPTKDGYVYINRINILTGWMGWGRNYQKRHCLVASRRCLLVLV